MDDTHLRALIGERHVVSSPTALRQAEGYLIEQFKVLGLDVSTHPFQALGDTYRNVIGSRPASHPSPASDEPLRCSVPDLRVANLGGLPLLLLDGEQLVGAKQNRILSMTVLVAAQSEVTIPVTCVEPVRLC